MFFEKGKAGERKISAAKEPMQFSSQFLLNVGRSECESLRQLTWGVGGDALQFLSLFFFRNFRPVQKMVNARYGNAFPSMAQLTQCTIYTDPSNPIQQK